MCFIRRRPHSPRLAAIVSDPFNVVAWEDYPGLSRSGAPIPFCPCTNCADTESPLQRSSPSFRCICTSKGSRFGCRLCTLRAPEITNPLPVGREVPRRRTARDARLCPTFLPRACGSKGSAFSAASSTRHPFFPHILQVYDFSRPLLCQPSLTAALV